MIEIKDIEKLANLARINIAEEEKEKVRKDINSILEYVSQVSEAETLAASADVATSKTDHAAMVQNVLREDVNPHESGMYTEKLLAEAPEREGNYVKVKKIL